MGEFPIADVYLVSISSILGICNMLFSLSSVFPWLLILSTGGEDRSNCWFEFLRSMLTREWGEYTIGMLFIRWQVSCFDIMQSPNSLFMVQCRKDWTDCPSFVTVRVNNELIKRAAVLVVIDSDFVMYFVMYSMTMPGSRTIWQFIFAPQIYQNEIRIGVVFEDEIIKKN